MTHDGVTHDVDRRRCGPPPRRDLGKRQKAKDYRRVWHVRGWVGMSIGVPVGRSRRILRYAYYLGCARERNRDDFAVPGKVTNKNSRGANTGIKPGAKLVATWRGGGADLARELRRALAPLDLPESAEACAASLFPDEGSLLMKSEFWGLLRADESTPVDEIVERLEKPAVVFRNLRRLVRTGAGRQNQADAGEEFCERLLSGDPPSAFSLTIGEGGARQAFRSLKVREKLTR